MTLAEQALREAGAKSRLGPVAGLRDRLYKSDG